ncbi:MAG: hypothetical protein WCJ94_02945 [bacterium]
MAKKISEHMEVEIAMLAGVLGFFLGGLINVKKDDIVVIVLSAVVTGVIVFFATYYAMLLVFSGTKKTDTKENETFETLNFDKEKIGNKVAKDLVEPKSMIKEKPIKGKKLDIVSSDDNLYEDLYKK